MLRVSKTILAISQDFVALRMPYRFRVEIFNDDDTFASSSSLSPTLSMKGDIKRKLEKAGENLDGIGGYCVHGVIEKRDVAREEMLLPHGLTENARLVKNVGEGEGLTYDEA